MIAQYLEWQIRRVLTHLLFEGDDPEGTRANINANVRRSKLVKFRPSDRDVRRCGGVSCPHRRLQWI